MEVFRVRNGEKWYYAICKLLYSEFGKDCVYYRGFQTVRTDKYLSRLIGVFETVDPNLELFEFEKKYSNYSDIENGIYGITVHDRVGTYKNCIVVWLR